MGDLKNKFYKEESVSGKDGDRNSGRWNSGHRNSGFFNTDTPAIVRVFSKEIERKVWDNADKPNFIFR